MADDHHPYRPLFNEVPVPRRQPTVDFNRVRVAPASSQSVMDFICQRTGWQGFSARWQGENYRLVVKDDESGAVVWRWFEPARFGRQADLWCGVMDAISEMVDELLFEEINSSDPVPLGEFLSG